MNTSLAALGGKDGKIMMLCCTYSLETPDCAWSLRAIGSTVDVGFLCCLRHTPTVKHADLPSDFNVDITVDAGGNIVLTK